MFKIITGVVCYHRTAGLVAALCLFAFAGYVLIKRVMHLFCCTMCQMWFFCCCVFFFFIAGCLASILIPFHLSEQRLPASALRRWEETSAAHHSWLETENAFELSALSSVIYEVFCVSFVRLQYLRLGAAGPANVTVKEENPRRSSPPLAPALQWCEDWTACQVCCGIKYTEHLRKNTFMLI